MKYSIVPGHRVGHLISAHVLERVHLEERIASLVVLESERDQEKYIRRSNVNLEEAKRDFLNAELSMRIHQSSWIVGCQ